MLRYLVKSFGCGSGALVAASGRGSEVTHCAHCARWVAIPSETVLRGLLA